MVISPATATITYKVTRDSDPVSHFSWAWIHSASGFVDDFVDRHWPKGKALLGITGEITGELTTTTGNTAEFHAVDQVLTAKMRGDVNTDLKTTLFDGLPTTDTDIGTEWVFTISMWLTDSDLADTAGGAEGTVDYELVAPSGATFSGTFDVDDEAYPGNPNSISDINPVTPPALAVWAENWDTGTETRDEFIARGGLPLGLDLGAQFHSMTNLIVPVPATIWTGGLLIAGLLAGRRIKNKKA